jgi:hypothetical protein
MTLFALPLSTPNRISRASELALIFIFCLRAERAISRVERDGSREQPGQTKTRLPTETSAILRLGKLGQDDNVLGVGYRVPRTGSWLWLVGVTVNTCSLPADRLRANR